MAAALRRADGLFPQLLCEMIDVGEKTGRLDQVFAKMVEYYDNIVKMRRLFIIGIMWPAIQLGMALLVVALLIWITGWIGQQAGGPIDMLGFGLVGTQGVI